MVNIFKKIKTGSGIAKEKAVSAYEAGKVAQRKAVNSKFYNNVRVMAKTTQYALKNPVKSDNSSQAREFRKRSNKINEIMFGGRYRG